MRRNRLSILKAPQLQPEADANPLPNETIMGRSRRVSFASNNFVKEFATDPERNTIWDSTYEESANYTDNSSDTSGGHKKEDRFNCTRLDNFDELDIEEAITFPDVTNKENYVYAKRRTIHFTDTNNDMDIIIQDKENFVLQVAYDLHTGASNKRKTEGDLSEHIPATNKRKTINFVSDMELTQQIPADLIQQAVTSNRIGATNKRKTINSEADMELTERIPAHVYQQATATSNRRDANKRKTINSEADMELTERIPAHIIQQAMANRTESVPSKTINFNSDMELTQHIPADLIRQAAATSNRIGASNNRKTIHSDADMDLTERIPAPSNQRKTINFVAEAADLDVTHRIQQATSNRREANKRKTINLEADMELTERIPAHIIQQAMANRSASAPSNKRKTINFHSDMELTQHVPADLIRQATAMSNRREPNNMNLEADMDLTERIPAHIMQQATAPSSRVADMDLTSAINQVVQLQQRNRQAYHGSQHRCEDNATAAHHKRHTINFRDAGSMDLTQHVLPNIVEAPPRTDFAHGQPYGDAAENHPINCRGDDKNRTIHFKALDAGSMDLTQHIPPNIVEAPQQADFGHGQPYADAPEDEHPINYKCNDKRRTNIVEVQQADFSHGQPYAPENDCPINYRSDDKRRTINFKALDAGSMDLTQHIPPNIVEAPQQADFGHGQPYGDAAEKGHPINCKCDDHRNIVESPQQVDFGHGQPYSLENDRPINYRGDDKRRTINFKALDAGSMDLTQHIPPNIVEAPQQADFSHGQPYVDAPEDEHPIKYKCDDKRRTNVAEAPQRVDFRHGQPYTPEDDRPINYISDDKRRTINFKALDAGSMDLTQHIPPNIVEAPPRTDFGHGQPYADAPEDERPINYKCDDKRRTNIVEVQQADFSHGQSYSLEGDRPINYRGDDKRRTINFKALDAGSMDLTQHIPPNIVEAPQRADFGRGQPYADAPEDQRPINYNCDDKRRTNIVEVQQADFGHGQPYAPENDRPINYRSDDKRRTINFKALDAGSMDLTQHIPPNIVEAPPRTDFAHGQPYADAPEDDHSVNNKCDGQRPTNIVEVQQVDFGPGQPYALENDRPINYRGDDKRRTINFKALDTGRMDLTRHIPPNIVEAPQQADFGHGQPYADAPEHEHPINYKCDDKRRTNIVEVQQADFGPGQPYSLENDRPINYRGNDKRRMINFKALDAGSMDLTQHIPPNIVEAPPRADLGHGQPYADAPEDQRPINYKCDDKRRTNIVEAPQRVDFRHGQPYTLEDDRPINYRSDDKRHTINFKALDAGSMDLTQHIPPNIVEAPPRTDFAHGQPYADALENDHSVNNKCDGQRRTNIVEVQQADFGPGQPYSLENDRPINSRSDDKRRTINFKALDAGSMDLTQHIPPNIVEAPPRADFGPGQPYADAPEDEHPINYKCDDKRLTNRVEVQQADFGPGQPYSLENDRPINYRSDDKRRTINFEALDAGSMDLTQHIPPNIVEAPQRTDFAHGQPYADALENDHSVNNKCEGQRPTNIVEVQQADFGPGQPYSLENDRPINYRGDDKRRTINFKALHAGSMDLTQHIPPNIVEASQQADFAHGQPYADAPEDEHPINYKCDDKRRTNIVEVQLANFSHGQPYSLENRQTEDTDISVNSERHAIAHSDDMEMTKSGQPNTIQGDEMNRSDSLVRNMRVIKLGDSSAEENIEVKSPNSARLDYGMERGGENNVGLTQNIEEAQFGVESLHSQGDNGDELVADDCIPRTSPQFDERIMATLRQQIEDGTVNFGNESHDSPPFKKEVLHFKPFKLNGADTTAGNESNFLISDDSNSSFQLPPDINNTQNCVPFALSEGTHAFESFGNDICQRLAISGQMESTAFDELPSEQLSDMLKHRTQNHSSVTMMDNITTFIDNTEHLINFKIGSKSVDKIDCKSVSEYTKIINEEYNPSLLKALTDEENAQFNYTCDDKFYATDNSNLILVGSSAESSLRNYKTGDFDSPDNSLDVFSAKSRCWEGDLLSESISLVGSDVSRSDSVDVQPGNISGEVETIIEMFCRQKERYTWCKIDYEEELRKKIVELKEEQRLVDETNSRKEAEEREEEDVISLTKQDLVVVTVPTLSEAIKDRCKPSTVQLKNDDMAFEMLYGTITFQVDLDRSTEVVRNVEFRSRLNAASEASAVYVHTLLWRKLSHTQMTAALGRNYSIFMFLDYLMLLDQQMDDILTELDSLAANYGLTLDSSFNANFIIVNAPLRKAFEVTLNLQNLDSITTDDVTITNYADPIRENDIKQIVLGCPKGIACLRSYIRQLNVYVNHLIDAVTYRVR